MYQSNLWEANKSFYNKITSADESRYKTKNQRGERAGWMRSTFQSSQRSVSLREQGLQVKIAQSLALNKINNVMGIYREAINDLEEGQNSKISKAEEELIGKKRSQILNKSVEKMLKQSTTRNSVTFKQHQNYQELYNRLNTEKKQENSLIKSVSDNIKALSKKIQDPSPTSLQKPHYQLPTYSLRILLTKSQKQSPTKPYQYHSLPKTNQQLLKPKNTPPPPVNSNNTCKRYQLPLFDNQAIFRSRKLKYCTPEQWKHFKSKKTQYESQKQSLAKLVQRKNSNNLQLLVANKNIYKRKGRTFYNG